MTTLDRDYDLTLYGATGFTGKLVAEYLAKSAPGPLRIALAGRDRKKLEGVRETIAAAHPRARVYPLVVADSNDDEALHTLAEDTKVVATTVGPFAKYGSKLVVACAAAGTDYCDLTGEAPWIRKMIAAHGETARLSGARIVHSCGFDSIPSDIGVRVVADLANSRGLALTEVRYVVAKMRGGMSGGTVASMMFLGESLRADPKLEKVLADPYSLDPEDGPRGLDGKDPTGVTFIDELGAWSAPFFMGAINTRIVRRSNALLGHRYGRSFRYEERMALGPGPAGAIAASGVAAFLALSQASLKAGLTPYARRWMPAPGEGPSPESRARGFFDIRIYAKTETATGERGPNLEGRVSAKGDPGYAATAMMISEAAICLAQGEAEETRGGSWTPASCLGEPLVTRLRRAGMTISAAAV